MSPRRWAWMGGIALSAACRPDVSLSRVEARLAVPTSLVDLSADVDETVPFVVELDHLRGETVDLLGIDLVNVQGSAFAYTGETGLSLSAGETLELPFRYLPTEQGFDVAAIFISTNAVDGDFEVTARGRALPPSVEVSPGALDFGPVAASGAAEVRIDNTGPESVSVGATLTDARFALVGTPPFEVAAGSFLTLPLTYTALDTDPASAQLTITVASETVGVVALRANDCPNGTPALYDTDGDGFTECGGDCDDTDPAVVPGAVELPNGRDDDCDGLVDDGTVAADDDGDNFCDSPIACTDGSTPGDCNDTDPAMSPLAAEINGNGLDDDCDGTVDLGATDADSDGFAPPLDCDDSRGDVHPGAIELLDGLDNDCDGLVDDGTSATDDDGDGYCEGTCVDGSTTGDCDDSRATTWPGAPELEDFADNDCDGLIDEGTGNEDADGDGFTPNGLDCDDTDPAVNPSAGNCP